MDLNRRRFLQFVGIGAVAGKLDFSKPRPQAETEFIENVEGYEGATIFVSVYKPVRKGYVELYLDRGGELVNAPLLAILVCEPKYDRTDIAFPTGVGPLGPRWRIVAKSKAEEDPSLGIGGELELMHVGYSPKLLATMDGERGWQADIVLEQGPFERGPRRKL